MESVRFRSRIDSWLLILVFAPIGWVLWRVIHAALVERVPTVVVEPSK